MGRKEIEASLEDLTLATVGDGQLEEQFQERIAQALASLRDHDRLQPGPGGIYRVVLPIEVAILYHPGDRGFDVTGLAKPIKPPSAKAVLRSAYLREGTLRVQPEPIQGTIPGHILTLELDDDAEESETASGDAPE